MVRVFVFNALFSSERASVTSVSKPVVFKLKLQNNLIMTSYYTSLYYVNHVWIRNRRTAEDNASDDMRRAAARSDQKINGQLLQVYARLHQCKTLTLWTYTVKRSSELSVWYFCFWLTNNWCFSAFQTCPMFKICLKAGCSLIYLPVQLKQERPAVADAKRFHGLCKSSGVVSCIANLPIDSLPTVSY